MKLGRFLCAGLSTLLTVPLIGGPLAAQTASAQHHHYKLIDVGTFGGPSSGTEHPASPELNSRGMSAGVSDTPAPDPFAPNCFLLNCRVELGFWQHNGVVTPLGALQAGVSSFALAINDSGWSVGQAQTGEVDDATGWPVAHAVLWRHGHIRDLGTLGGTQGIANAINNRGQVVGASLTATPDPFANTPIGGDCENPNAFGLSPSTFAVCTFFFPGSTETHAFVWQNGVMRDLHTLGGPDSTAFINNERGEVAGWSYTSFVANPATGVPTMDPFYWNPEDGKMTDLGGLGGTLGAAVWINNRRQIAGISDTAGDVTAHPFLWSKEDGMQDLGTLGGTFAHPEWLNDAGEVVGNALLPGDQIGHAFLWRRGTMIDLGSVGTDPISTASSINSQGQVIGFTNSTDGSDLRAFLWENGGPMVDLNALLVPGTTAYVVNAWIINDRGEIDCETTAHACVLIPCDENHSGVAGCDYSMVDANATAQAGSALVTTVPAAARDNGSPVRLRGQFRNRFAHRFPRFETQSPE